jgi:hypothetical protein
MFANLMVVMKSMNNGHVEISVEYYSKINYSEALKLAMKEISGDPIYLRIKQRGRKVIL